jgi:hypothetical protein
LVQGEQRNKWQGPAGGGKDAVYAGCELEPTQWSATTARGSACSLGVCPIRFLLFLFSPVLQFNLLALSTSAVRTRAMSLVARFKLLSAGAGSKHGDLCNEQIRGQQRAV